MSQDSNTENSSSGKKRLSLKRKGDVSKANAPETTPAQPEAPAVDAETNEPRTMKMSLKPEGAQAAPPTAPKPSEPPPPSATADEPPPPSTEGPIDPIASGDHTVSSEPKKIPITFADGDVIETPAPFQKTPSEPVKKGPKPPPGVKIVKDDNPPLVAKKKKADTRPPMVPPVLTPTADEMPAMPEAAANIDEDLVDAEQKKPKMGKGIAMMLIVFIVLVAAIGFLIYGGMKLFDEEEETVASDSAEYVPPSESDSHPSGSASSVDDTTGLVETETVNEKPLEEIPALDPEPERLPEPVVKKNTTLTSTTEPDADATAWVENMRPNAVMGNRMAIGSTTYRLGDVVNKNLAIEWVGHDPDLLVLTFRDANGVLYEKDY